MSSLFSHMFIPLAILFIFSNKLKISHRYIVILSFFSILPDADVFLFHRASFHNIFVVAGIILVFMFMKGVTEISYIAVFYIMSHLILDMFDGGIYLLYPMYKDVFFANINIFFNNSDVTSIIGYGISSHLMTGGKGEPMISSENIGIVTMLIVFLSILTIKNVYEKEIIHVLKSMKNK